jgi:hypothetical protein
MQDLCPNFVARVHPHLSGLLFRHNFYYRSSSPPVQTPLSSQFLLQEFIPTCPDSSFVTVLFLLQEFIPTCPDSSFVTILFCYRSSSPPVRTPLSSQFLLQEFIPTCPDSSLVTIFVTGVHPHLSRLLFGHNFCYRSSSPPVRTHLWSQFYFCYRSSSPPVRTPLCHDFVAGVHPHLSGLLFCHNIVAGVHPHLS